MKRLIKERVVTLSLKPLGSGGPHRLVTLFAQNYGPLQAAAFGVTSRRSQLRELLTPYIVGSAELSFDVQRNWWSIREIQCEESFPGLHHSLPRFYTASLWSEVICRCTHAQQEAPKTYALLLRFLEALDQCSHAAPMGLQFLWRYLKILGLQPSLTHCQRCERLLKERESLYFSRSDHMVCQNCSYHIEATPRLSAGARRYLQVTSTLEEKSSWQRVHLSKSSLRECYYALEALFKSLMNSPLRTFATGSHYLLAPPESPQKRAPGSPETKPRQIEENPTQRRE